MTEDNKSYARIMRYALDANVIVYAVAHHLKMVGDYPARLVASARVFARRRRVPLVIPACFLGEALQGAGADQDRMDRVVALCLRGQTTIAEPSRLTVANSILLRRQLGRGDSSRIDCLGYAIAADAACDTLVSYDGGFIGKGNRLRVPQAYRQVCPKAVPPECYNAEEVMSQKLNPKRRRCSVRKDSLLVAWERRANAAARAAGATTDLEVARFFCGTARAFMEMHKHG